MKRVWVGCCGYGGIRGGMRKYFETFNTVETQSTFYNLPKPETAERWAETARSVNPRFVFNMKAWQALTHPPTSPTWRRSRERPKRGYGYLRPTEDNYDAWKRVYGVARRLNARLVVLQTPRSFNYSHENLLNVEEFLSTIERGGVLLGWEPRGDWREHGEELARLFRRLDLVHVVDPFKWRPLHPGDVVYYRLHGIGGEVNYRYRYSDADLRRLATMVKEERGGELFVMFNNMWMVDDALRFRRLVSGYPGLEVL